MVTILYDATRDKKDSGKDKAYEDALNRFDDECDAALLKMEEKGASDATKPHNVYFRKE